MELASNCTECKCNFQIVSLCGVVPKCTKILRVYIGEVNLTTYISYSLVLFRFLDRVEKTLEFYSFKDGYLYFEIPDRFLNTFGDGQYILYLIDSFKFETDRIICIDFDCEKTKAIKFEVGNCSDKEMFTINKPCTPVNIICNTKIDLYKVNDCTTIITLCESPIKCETLIKL